MTDTLKPLTLAILAALLLPLQLALARPLETLELTGAHSTRGPFTSAIVLERDPSGGTGVIRTVAFADGTEEVSRGVVYERLDDTYRARLWTTTGFAGALAHEAPSALLLTLRVSEDSSMATVQDKAGISRSTGGRKLLTKQPENTSDPLDEPTLGGKILAVSEAALRKTLTDGVGLKKRLKLVDFLHVGVGEEVSLLCWQRGPGASARDSHTAVTSGPGRSCRTDLCPRRLDPRHALAGCSGTSSSAGSGLPSDSRSGPRTVPTPRAKAPWRPGGS